MFIPPSWSRAGRSYPSWRWTPCTRARPAPARVLGFGLRLGFGFGLALAFGLRPERVRVRARVQTLTLTRTLNPSRNPNLLEPVELAVDDDGKVATWGATVRAPYSYGTARSRLVRGPGTHRACVAGQATLRLRVHSGRRRLVRVARPYGTKAPGRTCQLRSPPRRGSARAAKSCTSARLNGTDRVRSVVASRCTRFLG